MQDDETPDFDDEDDEAPGWDAIDAVLNGIYGDQEPIHWATIVPFEEGGREPLVGISAYRSEEQPAHWHYVTYGFSDLYEKESENLESSGFGFELTLRLSGSLSEDPPAWPVNFLQNLARYVFETGNGFGIGHTMSLNGPIKVGDETRIRSITFVTDPQLGCMSSVHGRVEFLQVVGLTEDEQDAALDWNALRLTELMQQQNPLLVIDLARSSHLADPEFQAAVARGTAAEGASGGWINGTDILAVCKGHDCRVTMGAYLSRTVGRRLSGRIPHGRDLNVATEEIRLHFVPEDEFRWTRWNECLIFQMTGTQSQLVAQWMRQGVGLYTSPEIPGFTLEIVPTEILNSDGQVVEIVE